MCFDHVALLMATTRPNMRIRNSNLDPTEKEWSATSELVL